MSLRKYERIENEQFDALIALNEQCLELLEKESYENLLSLFEERDKLTKVLVEDYKKIEGNTLLQELVKYDSVINAKILEKKNDCSENLSAFYRQHNAKNEYIETHRNLLNCS